ncbi:hypothetical protein V2J09_024302 [Rumex salicifolius]
MEMGCCGCFGFSRRSRWSTRSRRLPGSVTQSSQESLLDSEADDDNVSYDGEAEDGDTGEISSRSKRCEEILVFRIQNGLICRPVPVKVTCKAVRSEDEDGNKMTNEYIRECKIGAGSYAKVVLCRNVNDGRHYAMKVFHKSHLLRQRVAPSETAMTDVLREVLIMKMLNHPNIVHLFEVIDDPNSDNFYMVLEYVEGKWDCDGSGPPGGLGEDTARKYLRDIVCGLMYLHAHNIVHMDIKPQNLLVSRNGTVKIADFSVSQVFENDNDELRRSPGTPVITAPECCLGLTYRGKAADTWAVGITLYCMVMGKFPFIGETLQDTYDMIVNDPLHLSNNINPQLRDLLEGLLCKDPKQRLTLEAVAKHPWVIGEEGPLPEFFCWCKQSGSEKSELTGSFGEGNGS